MPDPLTFNFHTFGDCHTASSRLRAWKVAERLKWKGHEVTLNERAGANVEVFQKIRDLTRLREVRPRAKVVVYDFDDNYLLDDVGTAHDVLRFFNVADLVTVGSRKLYDEARRFHDHVYLFENPIDILPCSVPRPPRPWRGRLGWFGNRANLPALEDLALEAPVIIVTQGGDVEWALDTVDSVLASLDLVLIPVNASRWSLSKNANRLLKCAALQVPFLASNTPEHEEAVSVLGLPDWLLLGPGDSWAERIAESEEHFSELLATLPSARERALNRYGIEAVTDAWLDQVKAAAGPRPKSPPPAQARLLPDVEVVILNENEPHFVDLTLRSLRIPEVQWKSVTVVSALPIEANRTESVDYIDGHSDYFDVYSSLAHVLGTQTSRCALLLRAGVELRRGFFEKVTSSSAEDRTILFRPQLGAPDLDLVEAPPLRLDQLLLQPYFPAALFFPRLAWASIGGLEPRFASLVVWEAMIRLHIRGEHVVDCCHAPLITVVPAVHKRHTVQSYYVFLESTDPSAAKGLPGRDDEWDRLKAVLQAAVIDRHLETFAEHASTVITQLEMRGERLARRASTATSALDETRRAYAMRKEKQQAAEDAYRRLEEKLQGGARPAEDRQLAPIVGTGRVARQVLALPSQERVLAVELAKRILSADDLGADERPA